MRLSKGTRLEDLFFPSFSPAPFPMAFRFKFFRVVHRKGHYPVRKGSDHPGSFILRLSFGNFFPAALSSLPALRFFSSLPERPKISIPFHYSPTGDKPLSSHFSHLNLCTVVLLPELRKVVRFKDRECRVMFFFSPHPIVISEHFSLPGSSGFPFLSSFSFPA